MTAGSIVRDEKRLFTCSVALDGYYGQKDNCLGVPVIIGKNGWERIVDYKRDGEEQCLFSKLANAVRNMNDVLETFQNWTDTEQKRRHLPPFLFMFKRY